MEHFKVWYTIRLNGSVTNAYEIVLAENAEAAIEIIKRTRRKEKPGNISAEEV